MSLPLDILRLLPIHLSTPHPYDNIHTYHRLRLVCRLWSQAFPIPKTVLTYFEVAKGIDTDSPQERRLIGVTFCLGSMVPFTPISSYLPLYPDWEEEYTCWMDEIPYSQMIRLLSQKVSWGVAPEEAPATKISKCIAVWGWWNFRIKVSLGLSIQTPIVIRDLSSEELWNLFLPKFIREISSEPFDPLDGPLLIYRGSEFLCFLVNNGSEEIQEPKGVNLEQEGLTYVLPCGRFRYWLIDEGYAQWDYKIAKDLGVWITRK